MTIVNGAHAIIYSKNPEADRAFFRDVLALPNVDVGDGWLIFGLPPSEVAVHPSKKNDVHEFYLMCDDIEALIAELKKRDVTCGPVSNQGWGLITQVSLPCAGKLGIYEPRHARSKPVRAATKQRSAKRATKKTTAKKAASGNNRTRGRGRSRTR